MEPSTTLNPGDRLAEFTVIRRLGQGGMGIVYLVRDERLDRQVALKVIAPHLAHDREFQERFAAEARSAAAIEHPNAVTVYSAGSVEGHLFIAMRYIDGTDLRRSLSASGPLDGSAAARLVVEVAGALDAAHAAGFVHRDVKPANILLRGEPGRGTAYLTDFGLTRGLGSSQAQLTGTGQWIGTLDYVAPEQLAAGRIDARTDIYSLGSVLYEMLSGRVPFHGDEMQKLWRKANEEPPGLPPPGSPHQFDPIIARAIAKDPEHRFRSAGDLGRAASAAAGTAVDPPTERSVATGVAAAGLSEVDVRVRGARPAPAASPPTVRRPPARRSAAAPRRPAAPPPPPPQSSSRRGHAIRTAAIVACALAVAAGLVAAALVFASRKDSERTRTVVTRSTPRKQPATAAEGSEARAAATPVLFEGSEYSATLPAGWVQQENEEPASDGSYVENTWTSPSGDEELLVDESPTHPADPARSLAKIAGDVRGAGETVYSATNGVRRGGVEGSELDFDAGSGLPKRADFFFNVGDNGFAVLFERLRPAHRPEPDRPPGLLAADELPGRAMSGPLRVGLTLLLFMGCGVWVCHAAAQHRSPVAARPTPSRAEGRRTGCGPSVTCRTRPLPPRCRQESLSVTDAGYGGVAAGIVIEAIEFQSTQRCYLRGYPSVSLLSKKGHRIAIVPRVHGESYRPVILAKRRPTYADLQYENPNNNTKACQLKAYYMGIRVPGGRQRTKVAFEEQPMRFCPNIIRVTGFGTYGPIELSVSTAGGTARAIRKRL